MKTFRNLRKQFQRERSGRSQDIDGEEANSVVDSDSDESDDYVEPELRPDGKKPRIKSNLKAKQQMGKGQSGSQKKSGFRHSKRVPLNHSSRGPFQATTLADGSPGEDADETDIAITTFRPTISLEEFNPGETNETFPVPATKCFICFARVELFKANGWSKCGYGNVCLISVFPGAVVRKGGGFKRPT